MRTRCCILPLFLLLASCTISEVEMPKPSEPVESEVEEMGCFELSLTGERQTRATSKVITKEEADRFLITIYKGSEVYRPTAFLADLNTRLPAGYGYRIEAQSCTEADAESDNRGWGKVRYTGMSESFGIAPRDTTHVGVTCSVANAGLEVFFDKTVTAYFTTSFQVSVTEGSRTIVFDRVTGGLSADGTVSQESMLAYFNVGDDDTRQITYAIHAESPSKTLDREATITLNRARISRLNINYEMSTFSFSVTVDEEEVYVDDFLYITDADIKVDDGTTDANTTHDDYTEDNTNVDISDYGQN